MLALLAVSPPLTLAQQVDREPAPAEPEDADTGQAERTIPAEPPDRSREAADRRALGPRQQPQRPIPERSPARTPTPDARGRVDLGWAVLEPVTPNVEDVNPLATDPRIDLRQPASQAERFERVYRFHNDAGKTYFARLSGGMVAVFERSIYYDSAGEEAGRTRADVDSPGVPPGVTFIMGTPRVEDLERLGLFRAASRLAPRDGAASVEPAAAASPVRAPAVTGAGPSTAPSTDQANPAEPGLSSIFTSERYRAWRLGVLIRMAAAAELAGLEDAELRERARVLERPTPDRTE